MLPRYRTSVRDDNSPQMVGGVPPVKKDHQPAETLREFSLLAKE